MTFIEIILISFSLSADAFSVATCKGLASIKTKIHDALKIGLYFGTFQMLMPTIGYYLGNEYIKFVIRISNLIIFFLLVFIGLKMIIDSNKKEEINNSLDYKEMIILSIATSLDAFAIGLTFSLKQITILFPVLTIGIITFLLSSIGFLIGNKIGLKYQKVSLIAAGIILIIIAIKNII